MNGGINCGTNPGISGAINSGATLVIYRNCGFEYPLVIQDAFGNPINITGYEFAFLIAPTQLDRSFGIPIITNTGPVVVPLSGAITFVLLPGDTVLLQVGTAYHYRTMSAAPGNSPQVIRSGRVRLIDAPQFP